jgi:hypothetical protein
MNTQPTDNGLWDNISKRADELKAGDHIIDRPGTPLEVTHTQARAADGLILVVFADGAARPYNPDAPFTLATEEQLAASRNRQAWQQVIDQVHTWLSWMGRHADELPAPTSIRMSMQHSLISGSDEAKRATAAAAARALGVDPIERAAVGDGYSAAVVAELEVGDRFGDVSHELRYVVHGFVTPLAVDEPVAEVDPVPIVHRLDGIGSACGETLRLIDACTDDRLKVTCSGCIALEPRGTDNGDPDAVVPPAVEGHGHQRGEEWRDDEPADGDADCDDPWHLDTGEIAPTAPCGGCGEVAESRFIVYDISSGNSEAGA